LAAATPIGLSPSAPNLTILAVPDESGPVSEVVRELCGDKTFRNSKSPDDLVLWRECRGISLAELPHLTAQQSSGAAAEPVGSPHARMDVHWLPATGN
jgi:hypothetical protein